MKPTPTQIEAAKAKGRELAGDQPGALVEAMAEVAAAGAIAALSVPAAAVGGERWRVFEDITHGWWGIEVDGDNDGDPILYPVKIDRERLDRIVSAYNEAVSSPSTTSKGGDEVGLGIKWLEPTPADGWRPVATAPKTGFFLAWSPDHPDLVMTFNAEIFHQARTPGTPRHLSANHFTLWMPIPLPGGAND